VFTFFTRGGEMRSVVEWSTRCCFWATYLVEWLNYGAKPTMNPQRAKELGKYLRNRREALGFSARHVAREVGVRDSTIMRLERGTYAAPAADKLAKIADVLKLDLSDVYTMAQYAVPSTLPGFALYLKSRYPQLTHEAIHELDEHFKSLVNRHITELTEESAL
jgi:transcriptional regulator with XRE-family HTH domain